MEQLLFLKLSLLVLVTFVICSVLKAFKQPIMIGYLIVGLLLGPNFLNIIKSTDGLSTFSQIGISFLLFMVGLGLNPQNIRETGKTSIWAALIQIIATFSIYFGISIGFGFNLLTAVYIGLGLSFSSTIVIMKILSDKLTLETLPGKLSVGILILQDLVAMLILMIFSSSSGGDAVGNIVLITILKAAFLISTLALISIKPLPFILSKIAKSQELLLLFSIAWCMTLASIFFALNFSIEIGALLAGISLSLSPYRHEIAAKMRPLRDFFLMLFFVLIGSGIILNDLSSMILPLIVFIVLILILNPLIVTALMAKLGYTKKTSFLTGINFSQISEFSLILASLGLKLGHLDQKVFSLLATLGVISITGSTYFINFSEKIFRKISPLLSHLERKGDKIDQHHHFSHFEPEVVIVGYSSIGQALLENFQQMKKTTLVIDYDPKKIEELQKQGLAAAFADMSNFDSFEEINFQKAEMVISTTKDFDTNLLLIDMVKKANSKCIIITLSHRTEEALRLYEQGANYVIMPFHIGGHHTSSLISEIGFNSEKFSIEKKRHISTLLVKKHH